jgi:small subunit ribosomal protein S3
VKVWIYKGDVVGGRREGTPAAPSADRAPRRERPQRRRSGASGTTSGGTEAGRAAAERADAPDNQGGIATLEADQAAQQITEQPQQGGEA